jgi:3-(3-hydroxy-phenyl)propionate hydroxylase
LIEQGLPAPKFQYRTMRHGILAQFDFGAIADATAHPYRLQCEQSRLTRILYEQLKTQPGFSIEFNSAVTRARQTSSGITIAVKRDMKVETRAGRFLIGADGARSDVRRSLGIEFKGFTWPDRFLVVSTPFDFYGVIPGLAPVTYVADPERWRFLLQIPGLWRVMFPVAENESDETALSPKFAQALMATVVPGTTNYEIAHTTLYKVHQRVAKTMRLGSAFLVGDAAHINNPLGGMGMNGGIHDAMNLTMRLVEVWHGRAGNATLDLYDRERRLVTLEYIDQQTIQNKRNLESDGVLFKANLELIAADPQLTRDYLMRVSMIASLARARELGASP